MPAERFYLEGPLHSGEEVSLNPVETHHLLHVLRGEAGDVVELVNGCGALASAQLLAGKKKEARLQVLSVHVEAPPQKEIILAQAIPRANRLDFIIEKGTELGMTQLWLFPGMRSERSSLTPHQLERCQQQACAAMKQCGRLYLPHIALHPSLIHEAPFSYTCLFGSIEPEAPLLVLSEEEIAKGIIFYIGPESGFSPEEIGELERRGARGVKLHPHILRTDTAALAALTLLSYVAGK